MTTVRCNDIMAIDVRYRRQFENLTDRARPHGLHLFETFRSDTAQLEALKKGTSKAGPGSSAHGWGLAADYVWKNPKGRWSWDPPPDVWDTLTRLAAECKLEQNLSWDRPHIQVPDWFDWKSEGWRAHLLTTYP